MKSELLLRLFFDHGILFHSSEESTSSDSPRAKLNAPAIPPQSSDKVTEAFPSWYVHQSLQDTTTPARVVHYVRESIGCDRVTLLQKRGNGWKVIEVSGVTKIHRHSQTLKAIESSARILLGPGELQRYPCETDRSLAEEEAIDRLLDSTGANYWILVPLKTESSRDASRDQTSSVIQRNLHSSFAILCERFEGEPFGNQAVRDSFLWNNCSIALDNWKHLRSIPVAGLQSSLTRLLGARTGLKLCALAILLAIFPTVLHCIPRTHWVESYGKLTQSQSTNLYASSSATVMNIHVSHGQIVEAGQLLLELESSQILQLQRDLTGQILISQEQLVALKSQQISALANSAYGTITSNSSKTTSNRDNSGISSEVQQLESTILNLQSQLDLVDSDLEKLKVTAPFRGRISTWDVQERLHQRPVRIGDWLLTLEPIDRISWQVELELPPVALGAIIYRDENSRPSQVKFRLGSAPEKEHLAEIASISNVAQASERYGAAVSAKAHVVSEVDSYFQSGTELRALIDCGEKSVWDVWTFELKHWWNYRVRPVFSSYFATLQSMPLGS